MFFAPMRASTIYPEPGCRGAAGCGSFTRRVAPGATLSERRLRVSGPRVSTKCARRMRAAIGLFVAAAACVPAAPAAAEPISVPYVKFVGSGDEQAAIVAPAGDVNGDGDDDVIIGAPSALTGPGQYGGIAYVVFGPFVAGTTIDLRGVGDRGLVLRGSGGRSAGASVAGAGDVNGDGLDDLLVGAPGEQGYLEQSSWAYVVFGRRGPGTIELSALGRAGITLRGNRYEMLPDHFGGAGGAARRHQP